ncbi:MAG: hypothetical protein K6E68_00365 [Lachnospiraceae bacterium]|nr:hypothetical protein [Lachnospiraceae bacterium]
MVHIIALLRGNHNMSFADRNNTDITGNIQQDGRKKKKIILISLIAFLIIAATTAGILIYRD